jgi:RNA polymerase sigma factor (sigma-70 family)
MMSNDMELLREYASTRSDRAFEALVARYVNLVYSAALRQVRRSELAEEVTQAVFIILGRKAGKLSPKTILAGWLYRTALFASADVLKSEARRQRREHQAYMEALTASTESEPPWEELSLLLDDAMARLRQKDRDALVLHYFEKKSFKELGAILGVEERAAQKRVSRSLDKLRSLFARRGITASATALASVIAVNSVQAAPAHLATSVAAAAGKTAVGGALPVVVKGALKLMAWHKAKAAVIAGTAMMLATGTTSLVVKADSSSSQPPASAKLAGAFENTTLRSVPIPGLPGINLHTVLKITTTNGAYRASLNVVELGLQEYPVSNFSFKHGTVRLQFYACDGGGDYEGLLSPDGTQITGKFNWLNGGHLEVTWKQTSQPDVPAPALAESEYAPSTNSILQGFWEGEATIRGAPLRQNLKISETSPGAFRAEMELPDLGLWHLPATLKCDNPRVRFSWLGADFEGDLNRSNTVITGTVPGAPGGIHWILKRGKSEPQGDFSYAAKTELQGHWQGALTIKGTKYPCHLHIARLADGKFTATKDCADVGIPGATATVVRYRPPQVHIEWIWLGDSFVGQLEQGELSGVWTRQGTSSHVVFKRK